MPRVHRQLRAGGFLLAPTADSPKLIIVGAALMAPYELSCAAARSTTTRRTRPTGTSGPFGGSNTSSATSGSTRSRSAAGNTLEAIRHIFLLTLEGLSEAVTHLTRGRKV